MALKIVDLWDLDPIEQDLNLAIQQDDPKASLRGYPYSLRNPGDS